MIFTLFPKEVYIILFIYFKTLFFHELMRPFMTKEDLDDVIRAFQKVYENVEELK